MPVVPPVGSNDAFSVLVGQSGGGNILSNDVLGTPTATMRPQLSTGTGTAATVGTQFTALDGNDNPVATVTIFADGAIAYTGTAPGIAAIVYGLDQNGAQATVNGVFITVTSPPP